MRTLLAATALLSMASATAADAGQRVVVRGGGTHVGNTHVGGNMGGWSRPGGGINRPTPGGWNKPGGNWGKPGGNWGKPGGWNRPGGGNWNKPGYVHNRPRWGGHVQGRWWGGYRAPGGWGAYQRPVRGWVLPSYWVQPNWYINDWSGYGLPQPPANYTWSRYYDDAVLIDGRGSVYDTIGGVDWDRFDADGTDYTYYDDAAGYDGYAYQNGGYAYGAQGGYAPGAPYAYPQRDTGLGGAAVGAVVGGVAGAAIAGRGNRLGGALIGGGVGAITGYAVDRAEDRGRVPPAPGYGAPYPQPGYGYPPAIGTRAAPLPPPPVIHHGPAPVVTNGGTTVVTTTGGAGYAAGGGYYANGYYYPGSSVTTISVQSQPVVTTTTTEIWEDSVTYSRAKAHKRTWRPKPKCVCR
ncbi:RcnB family protein [Sphingomonas sp. TZW2008]|uniref:RcnB family protein n=1 Tax=Sphingomonas sp. TZW2008 TaxID=1917973 RepID=UPI002119E53C|nr:RcnB family protein [Sphingomonas sp. TZW2008]